MNFLNNQNLYAITRLNGTTHSKNKGLTISGNLESHLFKNLDFRRRNFRTMLAITAPIEGAIAPPSTPVTTTTQESLINSGNNILNALPQLQSSLDTVATDIATNPITTQVSETVSMLVGPK
jgi:hypothetical protein